MNIDWSKAKDFQYDKWPEGELELLDPEVLYRLQARVRDPFGHPIVISPVKGAVARTTGSPESRHYAVGRLSDAIDWFAPYDPIRAWQIAVRAFNGVGIYYDTQYNGTKTIMIHTDCRPEQLWWCRDDHRYYYPNSGGAARKIFYARLHALTSWR